MIRALRMIRLARTIVAALTACAACADPTAPSTPGLVPEREPEAWQLVRVNGMNTYPWYPTGRYTFRASPSDSVDTRYSIQGGYLCIYGDSSWQMIRVVVAEWDTWNSDGVHYPPGGDFHGKGIISHEASMIGTEIHQGAVVPFSAAAERQADRLTFSIEAERGARYEFAEAGSIGSSNCKLALLSRRSMRSFLSAAP